MNFAPPAVTSNLNKPERRSWDPLLLFIPAGGVIPFVRKAFLLLLPTLGILALSACQSGGGRGVHGGTEAERAMVNGAINNMIPYLQSRGFPNVRKPSVYRLETFPTVHVYRALDGGEIGTGIVGGVETGAHASGSGMAYARPLHPWIANHEVTHTLLVLGGYHEASRTHDRRAFPDGPHFKHRGRIR